MNADTRAKRLADALAVYKDTGGTIRGLERATGVAAGNVYKTLKTGSGMGREMAARLAPELRVSVDYLLGVTEDRGEPPPPERAFLAWLRGIPRELWPAIRHHGDVLAAGRKAQEAGKSEAADIRRKRRSISGKGPT